MGACTIHNAHAAAVVPVQLVFGLAGMSSNPWVAALSTISTGFGAACSVYNSQTDKAEERSPVGSVSALSLRHSPPPKKRPSKTARSIVKRPSSAAARPSTAARSRSGRPCASASRAQRPASALGSRSKLSINEGPIDVVSENHCPFTIVFHQSPPVAESMFTHAKHHKAYIEMATKDVESRLSSGAKKCIELHGSANRRDAMPEFEMAKTLKNKCNLNRLRIIHAHTEAHNRFISKAKSQVDSSEPTSHRRYNKNGNQTVFHQRNLKRKQKMKAFESCRDSPQYSFTSTLSPYNSRIDTIE